MSLSTYMKLIDERPTETAIRLSLASRSYIYPLGIAEDVLVDVFGFVYLVEFVILDIKEHKKRPFILGTPFLKTTKVVIKFDKDTITLRSGKTSLGMGGKDKPSPGKGNEVRPMEEKNFKNERPTLVNVENEMDDEGKVTIACDFESSYKTHK
nr:hypothetical protein [Tanacetum cinerariifolium]